MVIISVDTVITPSLSFTHFDTRLHPSDKWKRVESLLWIHSHLLSILRHHLSTLRNTSNTSTYANPSPSNPQKVHVSTETVIQPVYATFGTESIFVTCPYCHHTDSTEIEHTVGSEALLWACIIPCFGFCRKSKWDTVIVAKIALM